MTVPNRPTRRDQATGRIVDDAVVSIGGKGACDQGTVQCDYFPGAIDRFQVDAG